jgi:hypothetical protein
MEKRRVKGEALMRQPNGKFSAHDKFPGSGSRFGCRYECDTCNGDARLLFKKVPTHPGYPLFAAEQTHSTPLFQLFPVTCLPGTNER